MTQPPLPMRLPEGTALNVDLEWDLQTRVRVGRLGVRGRQVLFEYDSEFAARGADLSPLKLPRRTGVIALREPAFEHLPGVFADSLPDGWGRLLLDRLARRRGLRPELLTPLDRLAHVGRDGIGALVYAPELTKDTGESPVDLDEIAGASQAILTSDSDRLIDELRRIGGSPQGARPKALIQLHSTNGQISSSQADLGPDWQHWLVKFAAAGEGADVGAVELAYAHMAVAAGLLLPEVKLLPSRHGPGYFASRRFDRDGTRRTHVATAAGLLHADFRLPSLDYLDLTRLTLHLTRDQREAERMVRLAIFNVLAHNRDDHAKQFTFLMNPAGQWRLAPAYDLTFSTGPGGDHSTSLAGEGRAPALQHLQKIAAVAGMDPRELHTLVDQTSEAVAHWSDFARDAGVAPATAARIANHLHPHLTR